jgi:hypothetical protein
MSESSEGSYPQRPTPPKSEVSTDCECLSKEDLIKLREKQLGSNGYQGN